MTLALSSSVSPVEKKRVLTVITKGDNACEMLGTVPGTHDAPQMVIITAVL